jgi:glucose-6-phosphate dehydrogenase assembly protein OpcA
MPATFDTSKLGQPVPVGRISNELKKLWETGGGASTRASLINFAIYCRSTEELEANTELISEFTRHHACRALLVAVIRNAPENRISAWINAHCHLSRAGAKQICCEQISFLLEGEIKGRLTNIVFGNLDSDLPLYFWWQGDLSENLNPHLWTWIDRLIVDSACWKNPKAQFTRLKQSFAENKARLTLRDLNWTRSLYIRQAFSAIFDAPDDLPQLSLLRRLTITHAPDSRSTAVFLAGWFAGQLQWTLKSESPIVFTAVDGGEIAVDLQSAPGPALAGATATTESATYSVAREAGSRVLHARIQHQDGNDFHPLFPAGPEEIIDLLNEEMSRSSKDNIYLRALGKIETLL